MWPPSFHLILNFNVTSFTQISQQNKKVFILLQYLALPRSDAPDTLPPPQVEVGEPWGEEGQEEEEEREEVDDEGQEEEAEEYEEGEEERGEEDLARRGMRGGWWPPPSPHSRSGRQLHRNIAPALNTWNTT